MALQHNGQHHSSEITENEIQNAEWKIPGIDKLQNFWWKKRSVLHHGKGNRQPNEKPRNFPAMVDDRKNNTDCKENPSNHRPITSLPIIYKIHTSVLTSRMNHHIESTTLSRQNRKDTRKNTFGTIDQLLINKTIQEDAKKKKKNL